MMHFSVLHDWNAHTRTRLVVYLGGTIISVLVFNTACTLQDSRAMETHNSKLSMQANISTLFCHPKIVCQVHFRTMLLSFLLLQRQQHYNLLSLTAPSPTSVLA
jgi:hypothetical protein